MDNAVNSDEALILFNTLLNLPERDSGFEILSGFVHENPDDRLSLLISDNWDLVLQGSDNGRDIVKAIIQLVLELPEEDMFRNSILQRARHLDIGRVYYRDKDNAHLNTDEYRVLDGHGSTITAMLNIGNGRFVSGDYSGEMLVWNSVYPPLFQRFGEHESKIVAFRSLGEKYFISCSDDNTVILWDSITCKQLQIINSEIDILGIETFGDDLFVILSQLEWKTEIEIIHEFIKPVKVELKAYNPGESGHIWQREFQVDGYSELKHLPDGRLFLLLSEFNGYESCCFCSSGSIIDPVTGKSDETFQRSSKDCMKILYSSIEMPVILHENEKSTKLIQYNGNEIPVTEYLRKQLLTDRFPMLMKGPSFFFMGENKHVMLQAPSYDEETSKEYPLGGEPEILRGRYLTGISRLQSWGSKSKERYSYTIHDLQTGRTVLSTKVSYGEEHVRSNLVGDKSVVFTTPDETLRLQDLESKTSSSFRHLDKIDEEKLGSAIYLKGTGVIISGSYGNLYVLEPRIGQEISFEKGDPLKSILGAKDNLFFGIDRSGRLVVYDADLCREINRMGKFRDSIQGIIHFEDDHFGAWSPEDGFVSWNVRAGRKKFEYSMDGYELTGVLLLKDGSLLCWGSKCVDSLNWTETRIVEVDCETGEERELLRISDKKDPLSGVISFTKFNAIAGQCLELSDGRILIPPHWGLPYRERTSFDIFCLDRKKPEDLKRIPLDGYTPKWIQELPGGILMICTGHNAYDNDKRESRVFFRSLDTGELLYTSPPLDGHIYETFEVEPGLIGGLETDYTVSLFSIGDTIKYKGNVQFEELIEEHPDMIERNRPSKEIGRIGRFLTMPSHISSLDYRWSEFWGTYRGKTVIGTAESMVAAWNPEWTARCVGRLPLKRAFLFEHSIAVQTYDDRIGFLKEAVFGGSDST